MDKQFVAIVQKLIAEQGKDALLTKGKSFLGDYTGMDYKRESRLVVQALEAGAGKAINNAGNLEACKKQYTRLLQEDYYLSPDAAMDVVDTLALVLRGDPTKTAETERAKAGAEKKAAVAKAEAMKAEAERVKAEAAAKKTEAERAKVAEAAVKKAAKSKFTAKQKLELRLFCFLCATAGGIVDAIAIGVVGGIAGIISSGLGGLGGGIISGGIFGGIVGIATGVILGIDVGTGNYNLCGIGSIFGGACIISGVIGGIVGNHHSFGIASGVIIGVLSVGGGWVLNTFLAEQIIEW